MLITPDISCANDKEEPEPVATEQPKREEARRESLSTQLGSNRIAMLAAALTLDGFAVGLLPLHSYGNTQLTLLDLPDQLRNRIVNCRAIVDSLQAHDRISDQIVERALKGLGQEGNPTVSRTLPLVGSRLYLMEGLADVLAGAEILDRISESFEVAVSEHCILEGGRHFKNTVDEQPLPHKHRNSCNA